MTQGEGYSKQIELGFIDLLSLEPLDKLNRPFRVKDKTFLEVAVARIGEPDADAGKVAEDKVYSITPASSDKRMVANTIYALEEKNHAVFEEFLVSQEAAVDKMFSELRSISTLKCLADKSLSIKPKEDLTVQRHTMERYYIWGALVRYWHRIYARMSRSKDPNEKQSYESIAGLVYRLIFQKAYGATNEAYDYKERTCLKIIFCCRCSKRKYVKNLWDRIGVRPIAPYSKYDPSHNIWRNYQINERKDRKRFRSMDRIKLLNNILLDSFNIFELQNSSIIESYFGLHDRYFLYGESKLELFEKFDEVMNFEATIGSDMAVKREQLFALLSGMEDQADTSDFLKTPLNQSLSCKFYDPATIDIEAVQNYFGEKIALYFEFLMFHTKRLFWIGVFGVLVFILDMILIHVVGLDKQPPNVFKPNDPNYSSLYNTQYWALIVYKINRVVLAVATVIWSSFYLEFWKRKQQYFSIFYGMTEFENSENKRPNFKGDFVRNLSSSAFNMLYYPSIKRLWRTLFTYLIVFVIIIISVLISIACLKIKVVIDKATTADGKGDPILAYSVPAFLNFCALKITEFFFYRLSVFFNMKENHETLTKFEDSLINKIFAFNFFNSFNSYFLIGFVQYIKERSGGDFLGLIDNCIGVSKDYPANLSCYEEMTGQSWTFFVLIFIFNFFEIIFPFIKKKFKKQFHGLPRKYLWGKIDEVIEKEYGRVSFQATAEVDGVLFDYSEVTLQFANLSFFGMLFPLAYILSYFTSTFELHIDKVYYMNFIRRPIPRSASDIGNWQYLLEAVSFFTIFINSAIIVFTTEGFREINYIIFSGDNNKQIDAFSMQMKYFVFLVFVLLFIKLLVGVMVKDTPENLKIILNRHKHIIGRTIKKPRESNANGKSGFPIQPLPNQVLLLTDGRKNNQAAPSEAPAARDKSVRAPVPEQPGLTVKEQIQYKADDFKVD